MGEAEGKAPPHMSPPVSNIHNSLYNVIELSKKQQWGITRTYLKITDCCRSAINAE